MELPKNVLDADGARTAEPELPKSVLLLEKDGKKYYIVGTAHVSQKSIEDVHTVIDLVKPDTVCVELCETRYKALTDDSHWRKLDIFQVLKQGKALFLLGNLALSSFQKRMGDNLGVKPGSELLEGVNKAKEVGAELVLADREIQITLKRSWSNLSLWKKLLVFSGLVESLVSDTKITEEELESLKDQDQLTAMMEEFAKAMPEVKTPLIDERDQFLMSHIEEAPGKTIVAVVGAGHVKGMTQHFGKPIDREKINVIPPPGKMMKVLKWVIPLLVLGLFYIGYSKHQGEGLEQMFWAWVLPNSVGAAVLTLLAGAKPLSILAAFIASPITSLNPSLSAGMIVGLIEAWLRKPTVEDCERIQDDIKTFKGFYRNAFTRVLLVFMLASLGSAIGAWIGLGWLVSLWAS